MDVDLLAEAKELAERAESIVRAGRRYIGDDPEVIGISQCILEVIGEIDRRQQRERSEFAWDVHKLAGSQSSVRRALAGLAWTLGDVTRARALGERLYAATPSYVDSITNMTLDQNNFDPFILIMWSELLSRAEDELRNHKGVTRRLRIHLTRLFRKSQYEHMSLLSAYASLASEIFGGPPDPAHVKDYEQCYRDLAPVLNEAPGDVLIRASGLRNLVIARSDDERIATWQWLAAEAITVAAATVIDGVPRSYDRSLDIPFYYLPAETLSALEEKIGLIGDFRYQSQGHWLVVNPPIRPAALAGRARQLIEREDELMLELRDCRFFMLLRSLPMPLATYQSLHEELTTGQVDAWQSPERARDRYSELVAEIGQMWSRRTPRTLKLYSQLRTSADAPISQFSQCLSPDWPSGNRRTDGRSLEPEDSQ
jgi:hypothetical protein